MNDYTVTMIYDQFNITTVAYAENEEEAQMVAMQKMTQDEGLKIGYPIDWDIVLEGEFAPRATICGDHLVQVKDCGCLL